MANTSDSQAASNWITLNLHRRIATLEEQLRERDCEIEELKQKLEERENIASQSRESDLPEAA